MNGELTRTIAGALKLASAAERLRDDLGRLLPRTMGGRDHHVTHRAYTITNDLCRLCAIEGCDSKSQTLSRYLT